MSPATRPSRFTFHLQPNAHLDPVWRWDWREGLNEGSASWRLTGHNGKWRIHRATALD